MTISGPITFRSIFDSFPRTFSTIPFKSETSCSWYFPSASFSPPAAFCSAASTSAVQHI